MQISLPPTITHLTKTIEAANGKKTAAELVSAAANALAEYNKLHPNVKAAFLQRLRQEKAQLQKAFAGVMHQYIAQYMQHPTAESAGIAGQLAMQAGDSTNADKYFAEQAQLANDSATQATAYANRAEVQLKAAGGRGGIRADVADNAKRNFDKAAQLRPDIALTNRRAADKIAPSTATSPGAELDFNSEGLKQLLAGDFDAAKEAFEQAVDHDPDNAEFLNNLSLTCSYAGQFGRAAKLAMRALKLNPSTKTNNLVLATGAMQAAIDANK
jgi:tetratricopeptide (TPR) repeat protein